MLKTSSVFARHDEKKGGARFATLRSPVGHGIPFGWVGCPMKGRDTG